MAQNSQGLNETPSTIKSFVLNKDERLIFQEKLPAALLFISETRITYISEVSTAINSNFAHTKKVITRLENLKLVSSFMQGRTRYLHLTPKGYHLAELINSVCYVINEPAENFEISKDPKDSKTVSIDPESISYIEDPVLLKQIINVNAQINEIYEEWKKDPEKDIGLLHVQLGPLDRELKRIEQLIYQKGIDSPVLLENYRELSKTYEKYMKKE